MKVQQKEAHMFKAII